MTLLHFSSKPASKINHRYPYFTGNGENRFLRIFCSCREYWQREKPSNERPLGRDALDHSTLAATKRGAEYTDDGSGESAVASRECVPGEDLEDESDQDVSVASAPDDSADEVWEDGSLFSSSGSEDDSREERGGAVHWTGDEMRVAVTSIIDADTCEANCVSEKEEELQSCLLALQRLGKQQRRLSMLTALSELKTADIAQRHRGHGARDRFAYFLPMVGKVCRRVFCLAYNVAPVTIKRLRQQIKDGSFAPKEHGGRINADAAKVDVAWLVEWFTSFARQVAELVPVHVRRQETVNGAVKRYYSPVDFFLLPSYFT